MEEITKHINDTNASYRHIGAGNAKNTDLFLDNEHYELFQDCGEQITVRFDKTNLTQAILFIASILPRKFDQSANHYIVNYSDGFVFDQLAILDALFKDNGVSVNARKDVPKRNGEIDNRFYFNNLLKEVEYKDYTGTIQTTKFTIRNYFAGGFSNLNIKKASDVIFDVRIDNVTEPYDDGKENGLEEVVSLQAESCNKISRQIIYYGAPGTGKSHKIEETYLKGRAHFRITFHPDTDYAGFVGCYKPTMGGDTGDKITYSFVPQVFLKAYVEAWKLNRSGEPVYLVIEELNRGNCAQIFGDVFQLLDRQLEGHPGYSKYTINADSDIARHLEKELADVKEEYEEDIRVIYNPKEFDFSIMALPDNLYILATMNTSDQSLFPIDSAFKRRWEMEYVSVNYKDAAQFTVHINDAHEYNWGYLLEGLNSYIKRVNHSTNKIIGNRFVQTKKDKIIDAGTFRDKVLFFLFNDVFKDNDDFKSDFFGEDSENMYFEDLCEKDSDKYIIGFIENETKCNVRNLKVSETKDATVSVPVEE